MRLGGVHQHAARAVHGLNAVLFVVDDGGVHVVLVVVPVARGLPQLLVHDERRGDLHVAGLVVDLAPVVQQRVLKDHAVGQEEREAGGLVAHHKEVHLAADLAVVALLGLLQHVHVLVELFLGGKGNAVDAGEHLVVLVALPVGARDAGELKGLQGLGVADMGAYAHVDVVALLVEGDAGVVVQVTDVLDLVLLAALFHKGDGLGAGLLVHGELEVLLDDLFHLSLDRGEVVLADLDALGQVDIVVEAVVGRGAVGKVGLGIEALDGLRHDVRGGVTDDVRDLVLRELGHRTVIVECLHGYVFSSRMPDASACDALGVFDLHHYRQVALVYKRPPHLNGTAGDFLRMLHRVGRGCGARVACGVPVACDRPGDGCVTGCEFGSRGRPSSAHRAGDDSWGIRCEPGYRTPGRRRSPSRWARRTAGRCRTGQVGARAGPCPAPAPRGRTHRSAGAGPGRR